MATWKPNNVEIDRLLNKPGGMVPNFVNGFARQVEKIAQSKTPVDTGAMRSDYRTTSKYGPSGLTLTIENFSPHAMTIHQGHRQIKPKNKTYLKFQPKDLRGGSKYIYTTEVRPVGGVPFLTNALIQVNDTLGADRFTIVITKQPMTVALPPRGLSANP